ncbi:Protein of unknown function [Pyronema omphalodes CBS 100304]|uniref:Uncharacterized protein n=1 Tax=Pyronema omphalodes (strain CBS 100304) TaxID=1076935 RepID=U4L370_PYROM|nr:Protein of unknown function [Pyronema omphalodes CBS 100304]
MKVSGNSEDHINTCANPHAVLRSPELFIVTHRRMKGVFEGISSKSIAWK